MQGAAFHPRDVDQFDGEAALASQVSNHRVGLKQFCRPPAQMIDALVLPGLRVVRNELGICSMHHWMRWRPGFPSGCCRFCEEAVCGLLG